jgi:peptidoglycan L-alanyl-D-glutamate endopeptidase CwlK
MIDSRRLDDLVPLVRAKAKDFKAACEQAGIDVRIISTYRDIEAQNALYAQGRTAPGKIVTNAKGGQSMHNWRVAFDVVPIWRGKPIWGTTGTEGKLWGVIGKIGESVGLEWGGRWAKFPDFPHFQFTNGLTLADFQAGKTLEDE